MTNNEEAGATDKAKNTKGKERCPVCGYIVNAYHVMENIYIVRCLRDGCPMEPWLLRAVKIEGIEGGEGIIRFERIEDGEITIYREDGKEE